MVGRVHPFRALLVLALYMSAAAAYGEELSIEPYTAHYQIKIGILKGTLVTTLVENDSGFNATSVIRAKSGLGRFAEKTITEHAEFMIENRQIRPMRYSSADELSSRPKKLSFLFDRDAGVVSGTVNDVHYEYPLDDDLYDRVTILYRVIGDIRSGLNATEYRLMDGRKTKELTVAHLPSTLVTTPYGKFEVVGIEHDDTRRERRTVVWCAAELDYLPVVIEQYRKGKLLARALLVNLGKPAAENDSASAAGT